MDTTYTNNKINIKTIELQLPQWIIDQGVTRIAHEHNTLCINYKNKVIRSTFYKNNIDYTIRGYNLNSHHLILTTKEFAPQADYSLVNTVRQFISDNWLPLIGTSQDGA